MKRSLPILLALTLAVSLRAAENIDWERAKALYQRSQAGEKLTDDEQKYLEEAKRQRGSQEGKAQIPEKLRGIKEKMDRGEKLTDEEQKLVDEFQKRRGEGGNPGGGADMARAKQLFEKKQRGETLTADEEKFLEEVKARHAAREGGGGPNKEKLRGIKEKMDRGGKLTDEEQKLVDEFQKRKGGGENPGGGADMARAKQLFEKKQHGETLTADEEKFLEEVKARHAAREGGGGPNQEKLRGIKEKMDRGEKLTDEEQKIVDEFRNRRGGGGGGVDMERAKQIHEKKQRGEALTDEEQKILDEAMRRRGQGGAGGEKKPGARVAPPAAPKDLTPLSELTADYKGQDGGLYGGGKNEPPAAHAALASKALAEIKPLDREGKPSADGKIALMSIGMSNTTQEFSAFVPKANADPRKAQSVVVVDAAQGGMDATAWASADANPWRVAGQRLHAAGVSPAQVQAVWIKQALKGPQTGFPAETERLRDRLSEIVTLAKQKYPNLRVAYLSSRIYAGYAQSMLNPEPYAYESAFAVRWLIQEQMKGTPALNADASKGEAKAPVLLWGPYLWANGENARKGDGLTYAANEFAGDGTHPGNAAREKVANLLLTFFTENPLAKPWFVK